LLLNLSEVKSLFYDGEMKRCSSCKTDKPLTEFNRKRKNKDGLQSLCKSCNRTRSKRYYAENREHHKRVILERNTEARKAKQEFIAQFKAGKKCYYCPEDTACCLDFHHLDPSTKEFNISQMLHDGCSFKRLLKEIGKCLLLCSNCHRKLHTGLIAAPVTQLVE
jgi:hypothetical protein